MGTRAQDLIDMHEMVLEKYQELLISAIEAHEELVRQVPVAGDQGDGVIYVFKDGSSVVIDADGSIDVITTL